MLLVKIPGHFLDTSHRERDKSDEAAGRDEDGDQMNEDWVRGFFTLVAATCHRSQERENKNLKIL